MNSIERILKDAKIEPTVLINDGEAIDLIRNGLSGFIVRPTIGLVGNREFFAKLLETSTENISRYYSGSLAFHKASNFFAFLKILNRSFNIFNNETKAIEWFKTYNPALGCVPLDLCDTYIGTERVGEELDVIQDGGDFISHISKF